MIEVLVSVPVLPWFDSFLFPGVRTNHTFRDDFLGRSAFVAATIIIITVSIAPSRPGDHWRRRWCSVFDVSVV